MIDQEMENKNKGSFLCWEVISKNPGESVLELAVFNILINTLQKMLNREVREFAGNRKFFRITKMRPYCWRAVVGPQTTEWISSVVLVSSVYPNVKWYCPPTDPSLYASAFTHKMIGNPGERSLEIIVVPWKQQCPGVQNSKLRHNKTKYVML